MPRASMGRLCRHPPRQGQCQEVEEAAHHPPCQSALVDQIPMIIQLPVNQVEAIGIKDASEQRGDWHQQD